MYHKKEIIHFILLQDRLESLLFFVDINLNINSFWYRIKYINEYTFLNRGIIVLVVCILHIVQGAVYPKRVW